MNIEKRSLQINADFFFVIRDNASNSIKVIGVMSRCHKIYSHSCKQSIYTKCVSEILQQKLTIIKEYWEAKLGCGFIIVKSLDKDEQGLLQMY